MAESHPPPRRGIHPVVGISICIPFSHSSRSKGSVSGQSAHLVFSQCVASTSHNVQRVAHLPDLPGDLYTGHQGHLTASISMIPSTDKHPFHLLVEEDDVVSGCIVFTLIAIPDHLQGHLSVLRRSHLMPQTRQHPRHEHTRKSVVWSAQTWSEGDSLVVVYDQGAKWRIGHWWSWRASTRLFGLADHSAGQYRRRGRLPLSRCRGFDLGRTPLYTGEVAH